MPVNRTIRRLREYIEHCHDCYVSDEAGLPFFRASEGEAFARKEEQLYARGASIIKNISDGRIIRQQSVGEREQIDYILYFQHIIRQQGQIYIEEQIQLRRAVMEEGELADDYLLNEEGSNMEELPEKSSEAPFVQRETDIPEYRRYDRLEAVRYAERWWNTPNPAYKNFENNCTNYLSQCIHAGGVPMTGAGSRGKGWWYRGKSWSYSWTVANAFRWYVSGARPVIKAREVQSAEELVRGDIICYDFNGDGRWQHTTIVTGKDKENQPLVNANTTNSRMRYWAYEDSTAWTPGIKYKFFHLVD
ncbi:amidase domain-containing protein [Alteribacter natronophilus]|uniref:amidase domain-containing protein n=1 Tax=Alteribacter natronophilus TaxID=2583810 RepID=UPI00110E2CE1|nr:amidase domain-containing protein [Alteribacter natronophilus]TMW69896.1 amidase domain-containing protein [Alteribacter natronophilus]